MAAAPKFRLTLFQCWALTDRASRVHLARREQRLVAALAVSGPGPRHYHAGLLWPESPDDRAAESLRVTLHRITHQLPGLVSVGRTTLALAADVDVDLHRLRVVIAALSSGSRNEFPADTIGHLAGAELLPGWNEEWVLSEQSHLRLRRVAALERLAGEWLRLGDPWLALEAAAVALELEPLRESAVVAMAKAHIESGNRAVALQLLLDFENRLAAEFGVASSPRLTALIRHIAQESRLEVPRQSQTQADYFNLHQQMVLSTEGRGRRVGPIHAAGFRLPPTTHGRHP